MKTHYPLRWKSALAGLVWCAVCCCALMACDSDDPENEYDMDFAQVLSLGQEDAAYVCTKLDSYYREKGTERWIYEDENPLWVASRFWFDGFLVCGGRVYDRIEQLGPEFHYRIRILDAAQAITDTYYRAYQTPKHAKVFLMDKEFDPASGKVLDYEAVSLNANSCTLKRFKSQDRTEYLTFWHLKRTELPNFDGNPYYKFDSTDEAYFGIIEEYCAKVAEMDIDMAGVRNGSVTQTGNEVVDGLIAELVLVREDKLEL